MNPFSFSKDVKARPAKSLSCVHNSLFFQILVTLFDFPCRVSLYPSVLSVLYSFGFHNYNLFLAFPDDVYG